jgi:putative redox protein
VSSNNRDYTREGLTVHWRPEFCNHCENCISGLPEVFDLKRRPWVNMHGASKERIIEQVAQCPTGALSVSQVTPSL